MKNTLSWLCVKALLVSGLALPQAEAVTPDLINQTSYQREFKLLDGNRDEKLSAEELAKEDWVKGGFSVADRNRNHSLDQDEFAAYKSKVQQEQSKKALNDTTITTKIKSKYLVEKNFKSFRVSVETKDGVVLLSGFVDSHAIKQRATVIAQGVSGVNSVKNGLVVKP